MSLVEQLTLDEVRRAAADAAGLPDDLDLESPEGIAAVVRRTASFVCPVRRPRLVSAVVDLVQRLVSDPHELRENVDDSVERAIAIGDLVEVVDSDADTKQRLLYLGYPRFVRRANGDHILLGIRPDGAPLVGDDLAGQIVHSHHLRRLPATDEAALRLAEYGLEELSTDRWLDPPGAVSAADHLAEHDRLLDALPITAMETQVRLLDPTTSPAYYRGRWRPLHPRDAGRFIARRPQRYGADIWCYVQILEGVLSRFIDLPLQRRSRGCDEAWRLQAAIDARLGHPQQVVVTGTGQGRIVVSLSAPPPRWLDRRWDIIGVPTRLKGAFFAYDLPVSEGQQELRFVQDHLWLEPVVGQRERRGQ